MRYADGRRFLKNQRKIFSSDFFVYKDNKWATELDWINVLH